MRVDTGRIPSFQLYGEPAAEPELRFVHVETIADRGRLHGWTIQPHRHESLHQLLLIREGAGRLSVDTAEFELRAPTLVVIPSGLVHGFTFQPETQGLVLTVAEQFAGAALPPGAEPQLGTVFNGAHVLALRGHARVRGDVEEAFRRIAEEFTGTGLGRSSAIAAWLSLLLVSVGRLRQSRDVDPSLGPDAEIVGRFREMLERGLVSHWPVGRYARELGTTQGRLNRACRRISGRSTLQLIHARMLLEAKRNLVYTTMSVAEVAYALGFQDPAYFSRFFARRVGVSPNAFRESHQRGG